MITEIELKYFQKHINIKLKLTSGFNAIIGESGEGKSSIVRALNLLFMNHPTKGGDTKYQNKYNKTPLEIQAKDNNGNIVKRTKRKYYLNDMLLKAINNDVPQPVKELFPFKKLNFKGQLDQHFLVLQTGGSAAKLLNNVTGMEDQENLIKAVKEDISEHKSNLKRLIKNNQEQAEISSQLKPAIRLYLKAKAIENIINNKNKIEKEIFVLNKLINDIKLFNIDSNIFIKIKDLFDDIKYIEIIQNKKNEIIKKINLLHSICNKLEEIQYFSEKSKIILNLLDILNTTLVKIQNQKKRYQIILSLSQTINNIKKTKEIYEDSKLQLKETQIKYNDLLLKIGECPLCGSKFKKEHHICNNI